jgi:carbohydrate diacid regulator
MQKSNLKMLFDLLCSTFEDAVIKIFENNHQVVFSNTEDTNSYLQDMDRVLMKNVLWDESRSRYTIMLPISNSLFVAIYSQYSEYDDAKIALNMAQDLLDLVADQESLQDKAMQMQDSVTLFSNSLFNAKSSADIVYVTLWGAKLGFDLSIPRIVSVINVIPRQTDGRRGESVCQSVFFSLKASPCCSAQDIVSLLDDNQIVWCKTRGGETVGDNQDELESLCNILRDRHDVMVTIGVGSISREIEQYGESLAEAKSTLQYARIFKSAKPVSYISDYRLAHEMFKIPREDLQHFLGGYLKVLENNPVLADTIKALVHNNMDLNLTSQALYIHRNTTIFRINKLKKLLKLNPLHNDSDRLTLILIHIYYWISKFGE